jgi:hypothetical protein
MQTGFRREKLEKSKQLGSPRMRQEDIIKFYVRKIRLGDSYWIHLAEVRDQWRALLCTVMNLRFQKCWEFFE